jgi:hypothetical protein
MSIPMMKQVVVDVADRKDNLDVSAGIIIMIISS